MDQVANSNLAGQSDLFFEIGSGMRVLLPDRLQFERCSIRGILPFLLSFMIESIVSNPYFFCMLSRKLCSISRANPNNSVLNR
jgi:hypothetical protein